MSDLQKGRLEFGDPTQASYRENPMRPIGLYKQPPPLLRTPDGIPEGWHVYIDNGVPVLARREAALNPALADPPVTHTRKGATDE